MTTWVEFNENNIPFAPGDYLVWIPEDEDIGNDAYFDVCYWDGNEFLGGQEDFTKNSTISHWTGIQEPKSLSA